MRIPEFNYDSLMKIFHTDIYGFPLFSLLMFTAAGASLGLMVWRRGTKVETKIVASNKATHIQTAEEFAAEEQEDDGKVTLETEAEKRLGALRQEIMGDFQKLGLLGRGNGDTKNYLNRVVGYSFALAIINSRPRFNEISFDIVSKEGELALEMPDGKVGSLVFEPANEEEPLKELEKRIARIEVVDREQHRLRIQEPAPPNPEVAEETE